MSLYQDQAKYIVNTKKIHAEEEVYKPPPRENLRKTNGTRESVLNGESLTGGRNCLFESTIAQQYLGEKKCSQINNLTGIFTVDLVQKERTIIMSIFFDTIHVDKQHF